MVAVNPKVFDRSAIVNALKSLSDERLKALLDGIELVEEVLDDLFGLMERCSSLVFRAPDAKRMPRRNAFLTCVRDYLTARAGRLAGDRVAAFQNLIDQIEGGYRDIAQGLETAAISALPLQSQTSAVLLRTTLEVDALQTRALETAALSRPFRAGPIFATDAAGHTFEVDGSLSAVIGHLGAALKLLSGRMESGRASGPFRIAEPGDVTEEEEFKAGTSLLSAGAYRRWRRIEERRRFRGGVLRELRPPNLPFGVASTVEVIRWYQPDVVAEMLDWIANERLKEVLVRQANAILHESDGVTEIYADIAGCVPFAPSRFVSFQEHAAYKALVGLHTAEPFQKETRLRGLTMAEWLRGYATLNVVATRAFEGNDTPRSRSLLILKPAQLIETLRGAGFDRSKANAFIKAATFGDHSDDLFDCPLIQLLDGRLLLFGPAAANADIARVVISNLAALREPFPDKGASFERQVLALFRKLGLDAYGFKAMRDGEPFQYDAVVVWDNHLFLFECKNEWLSEGAPIAAYNFEKSRQENLQQIRRLRASIESHPDIIIETTGRDPAAMNIVCVLLYAPPFAAPDLNEGAFVSDWSSLTRFFESASLNELSIGPEGRRRTSVRRHWQGERPTPADLVTYLSDPPQVRFIAERMDVREEQIWLADHRGAITSDLVRKPTAVDPAATSAA